VVVVVMAAAAVMVVDSVFSGSMLLLLRTEVAVRTLVVIGQLRFMETLLVLIER
jgi:hypothetical protein